MRITRSTSATAPSISRKVLEPRPQFGERRTQVVRDGVRHVLHAVHQQLDLIEHAVDGARQRIELIVAQMRRQAMLQISVNDG
jgi:hypothetical protein